MAIDLEAIRAELLKTELAFMSAGSAPNRVADIARTLIAEVERLTTCSATNHMGCEPKDGGILTCFCGAVGFRIASGFLPGTGELPIAQDAFLPWDGKAGLRIPTPDHWIPVTERLPEPNRGVIVQLEGERRDRCLAYIVAVDRIDIDEPNSAPGVPWRILYVGPEWNVTEEPPHSNPTVTHWMPLPEPPKVTLKMGLFGNEFDVPKELIEDLLEDRYGKEPPK